MANRQSAAIRVKAVAVIVRGADLLLSFAIDPDSGRRYGRLLGGAIEPGERADQAVRRELLEELGVELDAVRRLGVVENFYASPGHQLHEIIFVFAADFADAQLYGRDAFPVDEDVCDGPATWVPFDAIRRGAVAIYPAELVDLIDQHVPTLSRRIPSNPM